MNKIPLIAFLIFSFSCSFSQSMVDEKINLIQNIFGTKYEYKGTTTTDLSLFYAKFATIQDLQLMDDYKKHEQIEKRMPVVSLVGGFLIGFSATTILIDNPNFRKISAYSLLGTGLVATTFTIRMGVKKRKLSRSIIARYNDRVHQVNK